MYIYGFKTDYYYRRRGKNVFPKLFKACQINYCWSTNLLPCFSRVAQRPWIMFASTLLNWCMCLYLCTESVCNARVKVYGEEKVARRKKQTVSWVCYCFVEKEEELKNLYLIKFYGLKQRCIVLKNKYLNALQY